MRLLVTNHGRVLQKDEMMKQLWPDTFVEEGTLAQYISLLRKALGDSAESPRYIRTAHRRGYAFCGDASAVSAEPARPQL